MCFAVQVTGEPGVFSPSGVRARSKLRKTVRPIPLGSNEELQNAGFHEDGPPALHGRGPGSTGFDGVARAAHRVNPAEWAHGLQGAVTY